MKKLLLPTIALSFIVFLLIQACEINTLCTEEFVTVSVKVNGDPLDEHYTRVKTTGKIGYQDSMPNTGTNYIVLTDDYRETFENMTTTFIFVGIKNGVEVVSQEFVIKADECHIAKVEGPEEITY